jgi:hypothetical protein
VAEITLEINLYELTTPFEPLRFGKATNGNMGKFFKILKQKVYKWFKNLFHRQICYFLGRKFPYAGRY